MSLTMRNYASYFTYKEYESDVDSGVVRFRYELGHLGKKYEFTEVLSFPSPPHGRNVRPEDTTLHAILDSLHIILGISYWKLTCPRDIRVLSQQLNEKQATFWNTVYTKGLGEFFYKNSIDFRGLVQFPFIRRTIDTPVSKITTDRSLVLLGSGKDSIVSAELLKKAGKIFSLFSMNPRLVHTETAGLIGKPLYTIQRAIDPKLFELNRKQGMYNGHIPITAITSLVGVLAAHLYDFRYVISSNEESANFGNVDYRGSQINHQWSKSYEFETLFGDFVREFITGDIGYFSLLRSFTELHIVKLFASYSQYFDVFSSCNKNFKISQTDQPARWCGICPKCAFVFLLLAVFLPKEKVVSIFHKNLFADEKLISTYKALLGLEGIKPFECVGTPQESLYAFSRVVEEGRYNDDVVVREFLPDIVSLTKDKTISSGKLFGLSGENHIPPEFAQVVQNL